MIRQSDYTEMEEFSAIMNYDPYKERADELSYQVLRLNLELKLANSVLESYKSAYNKLESLLLNYITK